MSWNAAMSLEAAEFEALDLACRHYVDLGQVLGLSATAAEDLLDQARQHLERALGAEILASRGPACPDRDALLAGLGLPAPGARPAPGAQPGPGDQPGPDDRPGPVTAEVRERVLAHADDCAACGPEVPRNVSATRIFALLPAPGPRLGDIGVGLCNIGIGLGSSPCGIRPSCGPCGIRPGSGLRGFGSSLCCLGPGLRDPGSGLRGSGP
jgi:hypothetical protein